MKVRVLAMAAIALSALALAAVGGDARGSPASPQSPRSGLSSDDAVERCGGALTRPGGQVLRLATQDDAASARQNDLGAEMGGCLWHVADVPVGEDRQVVVLWLRNPEGWGQLRFFRRGEPGGDAFMGQLAVDTLSVSAAGGSVRLQSAASSYVLPIDAAGPPETFELKAASCGLWPSRTTVLPASMPDSSLSHRGHEPAAAGWAIGRPLRPSAKHW
jgi:hypothetical protein